MATIALYANQINQTGSKLSTARKGVDSFRKDLLSLRSKMGEVDRGICDLESEMADVKSTSDTQELKSGALSTTEKAVDDFIDFADRTDRSAADYINRAKADFYKKYSWLKPESEKSGWEKFCDGLKKAGEWCKEHWKAIVTVVVVVIAVVLICTGVGGPLGAIILGACWGAIFGAVIGGVSGGLDAMANGGSFWAGFENGAFSGMVSGALMGGAMAGLGALGAAAGKLVSCASTFGKIVKGTATVTKFISTAMGAFDTLALCDKAFGEGLIAKFNAKLHESKAYNIFQTTVSMVAVFTGGMTTTMKCFVAGTLVLTAAGLVAIEKIKAGDLVYSRDPETKEAGCRKVVETYERETDTLIRIRYRKRGTTESQALAAGAETLSELVTTERHPFYVNGHGFIEAGMLKAGAELVDRDYNIIKIEEVRCERTEGTKVYNFQVEGYHTYCVGEDGIWVHNANCSVNPNGDIEITDWEGYPEDGPRPNGKLRMIDGDEYTTARQMANAENRSMHIKNPDTYAGKQIHEIKPVKFGGSPTDHANKIALSPSEHREYSNFWAQIKSIVNNTKR